MRGDLTTMDKVLAWLMPDAGTVALSDTAKAQIARLITAASKFTMNYLARTTLAQMAYDEWYDGGNNNFMLVRQWPVLSISSIQFCSTEITTVATGIPPRGGYILEGPLPSGGQQRLRLTDGYVFPRGRGTVRLQYTAGYVNTDEPHTIPDTPFTITTDSCWIADSGVTKSGVPMTLVTATPAAGQYMIDPNGNYVFAEADAGSEVLISYSYVPGDIEQVVVELVGERYKARERIGMRSKNLPNGETVTFETKNMSDQAATALQSYMRVTMS